VAGVGEEGQREGPTVYQQQPDYTGNLLETYTGTLCRPGPPG